MHLGEQIAQSRRLGIHGRRYVVLLGGTNIQFPPGGFASFPCRADWSGGAYPDGPAPIFFGHMSNLGNRSDNTAA